MKPLQRKLILTALGAIAGRLFWLQLKHQVAEREGRWRALNEPDFK